MTSPACHAIIPAAGHSRRMGKRHKLLLPWGTGTIIDQILKTWTSSRVTNTVIVVRRSDQALRDACEKWPVTIVLPDADPPDMKASIRCGLDCIGETCRPSEQDHWLMAPADLPGLATSVINRLVGAAATSDAIVAPSFGGRQGHPVSLPWTLASAVTGIPDNQGLQWLLHRHPVEYIDFPATDHPQDIDTPRDYARLFQSGRLSSNVNGTPPLDLD